MRQDGWQARHDRHMRDIGSLYDLCPYCQKVQHVTRKAAKSMTRRFPHDKWTVYRCPSGTGMFHTGHKAAAITRGEVGRLEIYG